MKGICRALCFLITVWLTAVLIKAPNEYKLLELILIMTLIGCSYYGWSKD